MKFFWVFDCFMCRRLCDSGTRCLGWRDWCTRTSEERSATRHPSPPKPTYRRMKLQELPDYLLSLKKDCFAVLPPNETQPTASQGWQELIHGHNGYMKHFLNRIGHSVALVCHREPEICQGVVWTCRALTEKNGKLLKRSLELECSLRSGFNGAVVAENVAEAKRRHLTLLLTTLVPQALNTAARLATGLWPPPYAQEHVLQVIDWTMLCLIERHGLHNVQLEEFDAWLKAIQPNWEIQAQTIEQVKKVWETTMIDESTNVEPDKHWSALSDKLLLQNIEDDTDKVVVAVEEWQIRRETVNVKLAVDGFWTRVMGCDLFDTDIADKVLIHQLPDIDEAWPVSVWYLTQKFQRRSSEALENVTRVTLLSKGRFPPANIQDELDSAVLTLLKTIQQSVIMVQNMLSTLRAFDIEGRNREEEMEKRVRHVAKIQMALSQMASQQIPHASLEELAGLQDGGYTLQDWIKAASLQGAVDYMSFAGQTDDEFCAVFFITLYSFANPELVMQAMLQRYKMVPPRGLTARMLNMYLHHKLIPVRRKIVQLLSLWIQHYRGRDWTDNLQAMLQTTLPQMLQDVPVEASVLKSALKVCIQDEAWPGLHRLVKTLKMEPTGEMQPNIVPATPPPLAKLIASYTEAYLHVQPIEFARQLTLMEMSLFSQITIDECIEQIWKTNNVHGVTNLQRFIGHTNRLSLWVASTVVRGDIKDRVRSLAWYIQVALKCLECRNLNAATGIVAGLSNSAISRLEDTWLVRSTRKD